MNLYTIANHIKAILDNVDDEGEMAPDVEIDLNQLSDDLTVKADHIARYMRECNADAEGYKLEADRLAALSRSAANKAERLKKYLKETLDSLNITKLDTELFKFSVCKNSVPTTTLAEGFDVAKLPAEFTRVKVELDAKAVVAAWKDNKPLPDALHVAQLTHLRIK